jgi:DNA helicase-2/ATP-dependent DNA helicase PcrA
LAEGLELPEHIEQMIDDTRNHLEKGDICYEDCAPLMFLKLKIEGNDLFSEIKQVVIDEAQDYSPMQYEVFNLLFREAKFTVLGDIYQSIDKNLSESLYDEIVEIFNKRKAAKLFLNKNYRSSYEISTFSKKILNLEGDMISFERNETKPIVAAGDSIESMEYAIIHNIKRFEEEGFQSIAVICKTVKESKEIYDRLKNRANIKLVDSEEMEIGKGAVIIPAYMAKGLEFDAVLVYHVSSENYISELDKKLLYIACTRALHRLIICYTGEKSPLIPG